MDRRLCYPDPFPHARRSAFVDGFSLHAGVRVHANDREGLSRLCRYILRPPFAQERLTRSDDGRLVYRMKRPRAGSLFLVLKPEELVARLATLVPPPRTHAVRYHGVFAPSSKGRSRVVPVVQESQEPFSEPETKKETKQKTGRRYRIPWADLLRKVFAVDVLACPECNARLELVAFIAEVAVARRILDHLGLDSNVPLFSRARAPPENFESGPDYAAPDPVYDD